MKGKDILLWAVGGYLAYYFWGLSKASGRVQVTGVSLTSISEIILEVTNYSTVSIPFNGFTGKLMSGNNTQLASISSQNQNTSIPANSPVQIPIKINYNWFTIASLLEADLSSILAGDNSIWDEVKAAVVALKPHLVGTLYLNNLDSPVDQAL